MFGLRRIAFICYLVGRSDAAVGRSDATLGRSDATPQKSYRIVGATRRVAHPQRRVAHAARLPQKNPPTIYRRGAAMLRPYATPRQTRNSS